MSVLCKQTIRPAAPLRPLPALLLVMLASSGCKTGSVGTKPAWWSFGGNDPAKLTSAPAYAKGDIEKPSSTSKPYPVTSTPQAYSLAAGGQGKAASAAEAAPPAVVTYGSTPPPRQQAIPATAAPEVAQPGGMRQPTSMASISPQVGPYTSLPGEPPAATAVAGGVPDRSADRFRSPPERYADARPSDSMPIPSTPAVQPGARYAAEPASRFGSGQPGDGPDGSPQPAAIRPVGVVQPEPPVAFGGPAAAAQPVEPAAPFAPGQVAPFSPPSATPVPTRRPDPMYRPGGTSSYRPGKDILVGSSEDPAPPVRPVTYDAPLSGN